MITKYKFKDKVDIIFYNNTTKITNSYLLNDAEIREVSKYIEYCRKSKYDWKCVYLRNEKSYMKEIKAHNRLYNLGLWISHTVDTDLEEEINLLHKLIYFILGW